MTAPAIKLRVNNASYDCSMDASEILRQIYSSRGITEQAQLDYQLKNLPSPSLMKSNMAAGKILADAISRQDKLLVVADFDVDGATSCALMVLALASMGAEHVDYLVPDRFKFGYGLTPGIVDVAAQLSPDLIITVDNGIASIDGVQRAKQLGIDVLITDHHLPGKQLPDALAIVNPNQQGCEFPSKSLAGVGVAFYLLLAVRNQLRELGWFGHSNQTEPNLGRFLDLVALGTVADIVPLDQCNRILVSQGMNRIRSGHCRPGITALLNIANKDIHRIQTSDLGFAVGPRLNAAGRLDDMSLGIECLLTNNEEKAGRLAVELERLNKERRGIEDTMQQQARDSLNTLTLEGDDIEAGLCLYQADWHQGIIGLLASRIKDKIFRPVIIFADGDAEQKGELGNDGSDELLKGSARSIPGLHIRDILDQVATENPQLLNKFGGHAMAAGMTIKKADLPAFTEQFNRAVISAMNGNPIDNIVLSDGELPDSQMTLHLARELREAGPWGQGFEEPIFHGDFKVITQRTLSGKHLKLQLENQSGKSFDGIAFFQEQQLLDSQLDVVKLVYRLDVNYFRDRENLQLMIQHIF